MSEAEWLEIELWRMIEHAHQNGLNYWNILRLIPDIMEQLIMKAEGEYWLKKDK